VSLGFSALSYLALLLANLHPTSSNSFARTPGSRAPRREPLPGARQPGPPGKEGQEERAGQAQDGSLEDGRHSNNLYRFRTEKWDGECR